MLASILVTTLTRAFLFPKSKRVTGPGWTKAGRKSNSSKIREELNFELDPQCAPGDDATGSMHFLCVIFAITVVFLY